MQRATGMPACASCKHQRKKCNEKCPLAPYFPVEKGREFQAVQKVFGVSNVTKIITSLREEDRRVAVDSLVWEALCRMRDPILGPYGDYRRVCEELTLYKNQYQQFHQVQTQGGLVYKAQGIMGWGNSNKLPVSNNNGNGTNLFTGNGKSVVDFCPYGYKYSSIHQDGEKLRVERENRSAVIMPSQHHLANGFTQQHFIGGQYNPMNAKSLESTLWEGSS